ncbi:MAG: DNA repair protein RecO [Pseudomonadota bacterium]
MTDRQRVQHSPAYVLHQRPFRDSSLLVDVLSRDYGRMALIARGARSQRTRRRLVLQPFAPLSVSWTARSDLGTLTGAEAAGPPVQLVGDALLSAYYVSELLLVLTERQDPQPQLFVLYEATLTALAESSNSLLATLRQFELRFLEELGYGLILTHDAMNAAPVDPAAYYRIAPDSAPLRVAGPSSQALVFSGAVLHAIAGARFDDTATLRAAQRITSAAIDRCLDGRELNTRKVLRAIHGHRRVEERAS